MDSEGRVDIKLVIVFLLLVEIIINAAEILVIHELPPEGFVIILTCAAIATVVVDRVA